MMNNGKGTESFARARPRVNDSIQEKYSRQILFAGIGEEGQKRLMSASAVVVGCGAIGAAAANLLVRAGIGRLRIVDRDFVEPSNLQRQTLFDERDAGEALPKAIAAERKLRAINSGVTVEGVVADVDPKNVEELLLGFDLVLDGTDNFETRFLMNDVAVKLSRPWIYAAAVASYGLMMMIRPGLTPCLACLEEALHGRLISCDVWSGHFQSVRVARNPQCRVCARREFTYLQGEAQPHITMCGRDSVQIHERNRVLDLGALRARLAPAVADVRHNEFLLRFRVPPYEMTVFADGRAILKGTKDPAVARSLYARYIGA